MLKNIYLLIVLLTFVTTTLNSQEADYTQYPHIPTSLSAQMSYPGTAGGTFCYSFAKLFNPFVSAETGNMNKFALGNRWGIWRANRFGFYLSTSFEVWYSGKEFDYQGGSIKSAVVSNIGIGHLMYFHKNFYIYLEGGSIVEGGGYYRETGRIGIGFILHKN